MAWQRQSEWLIDVWKRYNIPSDQKSGKLKSNENVFEGTTLTWWECRGYQIEQTRIGISSDLQLEIRALGHAILEATKEG